MYQNELQESMDILREQYVRTVWETGHTADTFPTAMAVSCLYVDNIKAAVCDLSAIDSNFTASSDEAGSLVNQVSDTLEHIRRLHRSTALCYRRFLIILMPYACCPIPQSRLNPKARRCSVLLDRRFAA